MDFVLFLYLSAVYILLLDIAFKLNDIKKILKGD